MTKRELDIRENLAIVFNLLAKFGWDDLIFTHASARIPDTSRMVINEYGMGFSEITADNLVTIDITSNREHPTANIAGLLLHRELYRSRPEIGCAIHTHTNAGTAVSADSRGLLPISQQAMVVYNSLAYYDYKGIFVDEEEPGEVIAQLKDNKCMILRNHGLLTVGATVPEAFTSMYHLQKACEIQTLTDMSCAQLIPEHIVNSFSSKLTKFVDASGKDVFWQMLTRLAKQK